MKPRPNVICIQETWLNESRTFSIEGYTAHRMDRKNRRGGGVAIFVADGIPFRNINMSSELLEVAAVDIFLESQSFSICNIYHASQEHSTQALNSILRQLPTSSKPFLCGDFNSHHSLWGGKSNDNKGITLVSFIEENGLVIVNDGSETYRSSTGLTSTLDLTITTADVAAKCCWTVEPSTCGSDHFPVTTVIASPAKTERNSSTRWNFKRADWEGFSAACADTITDALVSDDIDDFNDRVAAATIAAAHTYIPIV